MIYADYGTSYRLAAFGKIGQEAFPPEELNAYSFGSKNRFFGNKLQVNGSAYFYDYENYDAGGESWAMKWLYDLDDDEVMDFGEWMVDPWGGSLGSGNVMGFDVQANAILTTKDMLNLSVSYIESEWKELLFHYLTPQELKFVDGVLTQVPVEDVDYSGKPMMNTPPWTITLNYSHNFNLFNGGIIKANITSKYRTGYQLSWNDDDDYPENYQENYHIDSVSVSYSHPDGKWSLSAYVDNIFNYAEKRFYRGSPMGGSLTIGDPRTYGAVLSVKY
jgi:iron complex outermembrane receptor protein